MSWWNEHINQVSESPFVVGFITACATSLLTTYRRNPRMKFIARLTEAGTCALLSLGLTKIGVIYFDFSPDMALPISVFTAWIGTNELKEVLNKIFEKWLGSTSNNASK